MSLYEWAADRYDERKSARKQRARHERTATLNAELLAALDDLLGDQPDIHDGQCFRCGRDYRSQPVLERTFCLSDACPAYRARQVSARATGGTP